MIILDPKGAAAPVGDEFDVPESVGEVPPVEEKPQKEEKKAKKEVKKEEKPKDDEEIPF